MRNYFVAGLLLSTSSSALAAGLTVSNGSTVTLPNTTNPDLTYSTTDGTHALRATNNSTILGDGLTLTTSGNSASGVRVEGGSGSRISLTNTTVLTAGSAAHGLYTTATGNAYSLIFDGLDLTTTGTAAYGVFLASQTRADLRNITVHTTNASSRGVSATGNSYVSITGNSFLRTDAAGAFGLHADNSAVDASGLSVTTNGNGSAGVMANRGTIHLTGGSVTTNGHYDPGGNRYSYGVHAYQAHVTLNGTNLTTTGNQAYGIFAQYHSANVYDVEAENLTITTNGTTSHAASIILQATARFENVTFITTQNNAYGISSVNTGSLVSLKNSTITTMGLYGLGLSSQDGARIEAEDLTITLSGIGAIGAAASSQNATVSLVRGSIELKNTVTDSAALAVQQYSNVFTNGTVITTAGKNTHGAKAHGNLSNPIDPVGYISVTGGSVTTSGETAYGLYSIGRSRIDAANTVIETQGSKAHALVIEAGGQIAVNNSSVRTTQSNAAGIYGRGDGSPLTNSVLLTNSALQSAGTGILNGEGSVRMNVALDHSSLQAANGIAADAAVGLMNLTLDNQSQITGLTKIATVGNATLDLALKGGSVWRMTESSTVTNLALDSATGNSRVLFAPLLPGTFMTLTVRGDLTGSGFFNMNTDLAGPTGSLLRINGQTSGSHTLVIADSGNSPASPAALRVVDGNGGSGLFSLYGGSVDAGTYAYTLEQQGDDWYLVGAEKPDPPVPPVPPVPPPPGPGPGPGPAPRILSKGANAVMGNQAAMMALWSMETDTLVKRLGELRTGLDDGGMWARSVNKSFSMEPDYSRNFDQTITGLQIGVDKAVDMDSGRFYVGGLFGYTTARQNFHDSVNGRIDSTHVGAYATYINKNGYYLDSVVRYDWMDSSVDYYNNIGQKIKGKNHAQSVALDLEVGRQIALSPSWFVEPQLELTYIHAQGNSYILSNGLRVMESDRDILLGRTGTLLGYKMNLKKDQTLQLYSKASYIDTLSSTGTIQFNEDRLQSNTLGARWELGVGANLQISKHSKVSLDLEYAQGDFGEMPWGIVVGYRYLW